MPKILLTYDRSFLDPLVAHHHLIIGANFFKKDQNSRLKPTFCPCLRRYGRIGPSSYEGRRLSVLIFIFIFFWGGKTHILGFVEEFTNRLFK
jgi:hypothetical protein